MRTLIYFNTVIYTTKNSVSNSVTVLGKPFDTTEFHSCSVLIISQFCCKNSILSSCFVQESDNGMIGASDIPLEGALGEEGGV